MANQITVKCPTCGYKWRVKLADCQAERTIYRGENNQIKEVEYRFKCPKDGSYFIVPVTIKE
jgi:predicted RNA-binding Zn-ribbon protein involved in translation (DUF1610 family)